MRIKQKRSQLGHFDIPWAEAWEHFMPGSSFGVRHPMWPPDSLGLGESSLGPWADRVQRELLGLRTLELEAPQEQLTHYPCFLILKKRTWRGKSPYFYSLFCILCSHAHIMLSYNVYIWCVVCSLLSKAWHNTLTCPLIVILNDCIIFHGYTTICLTSSLLWAIQVVNNNS